jgi:uncharacterized membrane protein YdjX (TVP38/TMEM64 family)
MEAAKRLFLSRFFWIVLSLVILGVVTNKWVEAEGGARQAVEQWGIWAPLAAFTIQTITSVTPIGAVVISVVNGVLFKLWIAIVINLASGVAGGVLMYYVWRRGDHEFDIQARLQRLPRWFRTHKGDNFVYLTALRLLPWAGGTLANLIAGVHRVPMRMHLLSLVVGYLPGSVIYALMGAGLVKL